MQRLIFIEPGRLDWEHIVAPILQGPDEALVRPKIMGRCDLDTLYLSGRMPMATGEPIGHEIIGIITDLGENAANHFKVGQTVIVPSQISCGICRMCRAGETGRCEAVPLGASYGMGRDGDYGGGVAELVHVPFATGMLVPIPEDADHASMMGLTDMATDAWRAVGPQLDARPGGTVLVMGGAAPVIGIYAAALAITLGASRTVYVDSSERNRDAAKAYGAETFTVIEEVPIPSFDIVVDAAGDTDALLAAIHACGPAAHLTSVAPPFKAPDFPLMEMYYKGLNYTLARPNCRHGHGPALKAWSCGGFKPNLIGPKVFNFEEATKAWLDPALYVAVTA
ncbi:MAG: alcohol dehydrogenase catalytic domain-containing protein [Kordiimonadaceae bacterium]|nr:alcohol dehydrogenase catalytic domain-containing protein [Kordiimonadaceae bacterium]